MMHTFLTNNRDDLIARCQAKVKKRPKRSATAEQLTNGVPMFLDQLIRTLIAEGSNEHVEITKISGPSGGDRVMLSEMGVSAAAHGTDLLKLGFTVDQVVHDYGDLCQSITDLAVERDAPFAVPEFRTLNRCLDNAIADAVTEFSYQRDSTEAGKALVAANERLGFLVHELRNCLGTAVLSVTALKAGSLPIAGATGAVLDRSLAVMGTLIDRSVEEVRNSATLVNEHELFSLAVFIQDAQNASDLAAASTGCTLNVSVVDPLLAVDARRELLNSALANLLQNAFKFTHAHTEVALNAYAAGDRILIDVIDQCGGLPKGNAERLFTPFSQRNYDKSGLGLGLSIARHNIEADGGVLTVRNIPGTGCVFTISLPRYTLN